MKKAPQSYNARTLSLIALNTLDIKKKTLDQIIESLPIDALSKRDRSLMNAITYGVLRKRNYIDHIIRNVSKIPVTRIEPEVLNILRIGLFQLWFLDRVPDAAAVHTSVELAKSTSTSKVASFVNAVLRNAIREKHQISFPDIHQDAVAYLSIIESFPEWMVHRWLQRFGTNETIEHCKAINTIPPVTIRVNRLKITRDLLIEKIQKDADKITKTVYSPDGITCSKLKRSIPELYGFSDGWFQVQDEAAQLISYVVDPRPGEKVLDACAGLGGKTTHMAQLMQNSGKISAFDKDKNKIDLLQKDLQRLGITIITSNLWDLDQPVTAGKVYDRILLDAPCSGLGVIRRNPDIKWRIAQSDMIRLQKRQVQFLNHIAHMVKPSGKLVYAVCSNEPEETSDVIDKFLHEHPEFCLDPPDNYSELIRKFLTPQGYFQTYPHRHHMDGFFAARLLRKG